MMMRKRLSPQHNPFDIYHTFYHTFETTMGFWLFLAVTSKPAKAHSDTVWRLGNTVEFLVFLVRFPHTPANGTRMNKPFLRVLSFELPHFLPHFFFVLFKFHTQSYFHHKVSLKSNIKFEKNNVTSCRNSCIFAVLCYTLTDTYQY